jgi:hypothetical protein
MQLLTEWKYRFADKKYFTTEFEEEREQYFYSLRTTTTLLNNDEKLEPCDALARA